MPARKTFSKDIIPNLYTTTVAVVKSAVSSAKSLAFTTDGWTSQANQSYLSYTAHFLTEDFVPKNYCVKVENVDQSHTADKLAESLSKCICEWTTLFVSGRLLLVPQTPNSLGESCLQVRSLKCL